MLTKLFSSDISIKLLFITLGFLVIQFFIIRPRKKEEEARDNFLKTLKVGMQVVTIGGLYGKIVKIHDATAVLEVDPRGFNFVINKQSISQEALQHKKNK